MSFLFGRGRLGVSSVEDLGGRRSVGGMPTVGHFDEGLGTRCPLSQKLVRRDREVRADLDVVDVG